MKQGFERHCDDQADPVEADDSVRVVSHNEDVVCLLFVGTVMGMDCSPGIAWLTWARPKETMETVAWQALACMLKDQISP